jgi:NAD(P)H dehydrogenase (quinone)
MDTDLIAVTGATGQLGTRVARRLADRGVRQRLIVRDAARAPEVTGAEVTRASSYGARNEMRAALEGVGTLFLIPAKESLDRLDQHRAAVDTAVEAGVGRIVYLSFVGARSSSFTLAREHGATEQHIPRHGGALHVPAHEPLHGLHPVDSGPDGVIHGPADEGRVAAVLRDGIADAVAVLLTEPGHEGQAYDLTGPEAFTLADAAAEMSRASGKPIAFHDETLEEARASRAQFGAPGWEVEAWISSYVAIANGELDQVSGDVERLTGHPPMSLAAYLAAPSESVDHVGGGQHPP